MGIDCDLIRKYHHQVTFSIPQFDDMLDMLTGAKVFLKIDLQTTLIRLGFSLEMNGRLHLKPVKDCINRWSCHFGVDHDEDRVTGQALAYLEANGHAHGVWSLDPYVIILIEQNPNSLTIVKRT